MEESLKSLAVILLLPVLCLGAASPDVAIYPGGVVNERISKSNLEQGPQFAELVAYLSTDDFEKVDDYYKKIGALDVGRSRNLNATMKYVVLKFPGKKYQVSLSRVAADPRHATIIQYFLLKQ
jgi:hypothetical protein